MLLLPSQMASQVDYPFATTHSSSNEIPSTDLLIKLLDFSTMAQTQTNDDNEHQLMVEELKQKEQRKCQDLFAELLMNCSSPMQWPSTDNFVGHQLSPSSPLMSESSPSASSSSSASSPWQSSTSPLEQKDILLTTDQLMKEEASPEPRPHKCDQCQKAFRFKSNLFEHKSLHLGDRKPFVCPFCAKSCRLKGNLKKHLQIHVTSVEDLERLWKRSFSRQSGRPRKNAEPAPLPKPGDDLGLVPVLLPNSSAGSTGSNNRTMHHSSRHHCSPLQWTFADQKPFVGQSNGCLELWW